MFYLVKRKKDNSEHVAKLNLNSKRFIVNNKDSFGNKKFHQLFIIDRKIDDMIYNFLLDKHKDNPSMQRSQASLNYFKNPVNGFTVRLNDNDPRIKEWGYE